MHKNEIKILGMTCGALVLLMIGVCKNAELQKTMDEKKSLLEIETNLAKLEADISQYAFVPMELQEITADYDFRKYIKFLVEQTGIHTVLMKNISERNKTSRQRYFCSDDMEIRFTTSDERHIYDFINGICGRFAAKFHSIEITKKSSESDLNFLVKIRCTLYRFEKNMLQYVVKLPNTQNIFDFSRVNLFLCQPKIHRLNCAIENTTALVDNLWFFPGDEIDGAEIKKINYNSIDLERDHHFINVKIGLDFSAPDVDNGSD
ncbi:MAG: hypothetical protein LBB12_01310 [Holosporaceae bacterium]|jgi:hypothetical protein|nr:hypothetical protein [Holosporaceae bacterium]